MIVVRQCWNLFSNTVFWSLSDVCYEFERGPWDNVEFKSCDCRLIPTTVAESVEAYQ